MNVQEMIEDYTDSDVDDQDEFEDAEDVPISTDMTLERALQEAQQAINYFFNNQFNEAKQLMTPYANVSMYHSLGHSVFLFLEAILTFEQQSIIEASKSLKQSLIVCNKYKKKNTIGESLGKIVKRTNFEQYTEEEAHAELCYAECLLLKAMLTFMEDETLSSFIKAGIKIRSCYNSYKNCQQILIRRNWENDNKVHFESGVKMGIGTFNLMISLLPSRVIKLLEFIGFSGNKQKGLEDLHEGYEMEGLRQILCTMTLLGYNLIVLHVLSYREGDTKICEKILQKQLERHPDGVWFLFFQGRLDFIRGRLDESIVWYTKSWKSQNMWPQFHHICYWELLWIHCLKAEWKEALTYSTYLREQSKWSRSLYSYQKAAIMCMMRDELTPSDLSDMEKLMKDVPKYKQRIAGKSLPMEKFAVKKAERYFNQGQDLVLPAIELMFLWNLFKILKNFSVATKIFKIIDKSLLELNSSMKPSKYHNDNKALTLLLRGSCLRHMGSPLQALECLENVISLQKDIVEDTYLVPYAIVELALIEWQNGNQEKAILALEDAKKNYTGYSLESRLHFRIHTALSEFKAEMKNHH
ncbi:tetratricopeptide repeat protein 39B [Anoplophora glabripennis]|nr:tetratricopeptide repeat protein 39B [Anoplophora glabripennis]XP_018578762.1 tetratricopeptide repeat protein 39B [Anoplophora glabripennis]XP_018578764.1 tetratricopeptide repeat protein 39B [Anoplophora glabripennis]XP_018578765.1 tetratricopeptide repeat protein 39B [Anoplophora glabripennis]